MPILNVQTTSEGQDSHGNAVQLPSPVALVHRGPCVQVAITVVAPVAQQLRLQGADVPAPEVGLALIDTGATSTCIDQSAAERLGLPVIDVVTVASASHAATVQNVYPAGIEIVGTEINIAAPRAIGAALAAQGIVALIGRDVLSQCILHYNGTTGAFSLAV